MPNVMAALPNIGGALCSTPQSLAKRKIEQDLDVKWILQRAKFYQVARAPKNIANKSPSGHHRTTLLGYIFATKARIDNQENAC